MLAADSQAAAISPPPLSDDFSAELQAIMDAPSSSPVRPSALGKRTRSDGNSEDREEPESDGLLDNEDNATAGATTDVSRTAGVAMDKNTLSFAVRLANHKRLRGDQKTEVESFVASSDPVLRQVKLFTEMLSLNNKLDKIIAATPQYKISDSLKKNIDNYAVAVLLSSKIRSYKGSIPTDKVLTILKKHRFDMPPNIEHNHADWEKVTTAVQSSLTQIRSRFKKLFKASLQGTDAEHMHLYDLAQKMVLATSCRVTVTLCARVALMRKVFLKFPKADFWDQVDEHLSTIRRQTKNNEEAITKIFKRYLNDDRDKHGKSDNGFQIDNTIVEPWQQEVDEEIAASDA